jgi:hypothetical protein
MMHDRRRTPLGSTGARTALALIFFIAIAATTAQPAWGQPCVVPDDGSGTVQLPPAGCAYLSPAEVHMIIDGLPPGTTIEVSAEHSQFLNIITSPGGTLGGEIESFESYLYLTMTGTDSLAGFSRTLTLPVGSEVHTGPRTPGDPVQTFPNDMYRLQGQIVGDPDFALLQVTAGTDFGLLSPGETTLTDLGDGTWNIDSFFDITYQIDFVGAPGGSLDGLSGSTTATIRMETGEEAPPVLLPCVLPDNGTGTVDLPPAGCGYVSPTDLHKIIAGLPPGSEIDIAPEHSRFINIVTTPGGTLGGEVETFDSTLKLHMTGIGALAGFSRVLEVPISCETHVASRRNGDPVQVIQAKMYSLLGGISGDPDFDQLTVRAGESFGLPASDGQVTLTDLGDGSFNVDSFFDITYEIEFTGAAGGALDGLSGTTEDSLIMQAGVGGPPALAPVCEVEDNGTGTADLPPPGCTYVGPEQIHRMIAGLPPGTEIHISPAHSQFFNVIRTPGGPLGGEIETFDSSLELQMKGIGGLAGFTRTLTVPVACETHTAPRNLGSPVQNIPTEMASLQGEIIGDPDFDLLRVTAGSAYGLPSPGNTELTRLPNGNFNVDSFFDIEYRISFVGAAGSALDGLSGSTTSTLRMEAGVPVAAPAQVPALGLFGLALLAGSLAVGAARYRRRRRSA